MIRDAPPKHPASEKWYWLQWPSDELQATIASSSWQVPVGLVMEAETHTDYLVGIRISGGELKKNYTLVNEITTTNNETLHETLIVRVRDTGH